MMRSIQLSILFVFVYSISVFSQSRKEWLEYGDAAFAHDDYASAAYFYLKVIDPKTSNAKEGTFPYDIKTWFPPLDSTKKDSAAPKVDTTKVNGSKNMMGPELRYQYLVHQIAESYRLSHDYANAELWFSKAVQNQSLQFPNDIYYYGRTLMANEKYTDAQKIFEAVTKDSTKSNTSLYKLCMKGYLGCLFAVDTNSVRKKTVSILDTTINQGTASFAPNFYGDDLTLVFSGARKDSKVLDPKIDDPKFRSDLYSSSKKGEGWETAKNLDAPINSVVER